MKYHCWTDDPNHLYLNVYFDKDKPNSGADYNVDCLQPVAKEKGSHRFVLGDAKKRWYHLDARERGLSRID
jgi:hypothetical protein